MAWKVETGWWVLSQQGIHYIDLLCFLFGKPVKAVSITKNISNRLEAEDTNIGILQFKNAICTIGLTTALVTDLKASIKSLLKNLITLYGIACNKVSITNYSGKR